MNKEKLNNRLDRLNIERREIHEKLEKMELDEKLPALKKKYEGKFFKYDNGNSHDKRWFLYTRCIEVTDLDDATCDRLQKKENGECEVTPDHKTYLFLFQEEITELEYMRAHGEIYEHMDKTLPENW